MRAVNNENVQLDRLEDAWRKLRDTIRQRESELAALRNEFEILDQARALLIMRGWPGNNSSVLLHAPKQRIGLKDAIYASLSAAEFGLDIRDLVSAVAAQVDDSRYSSERSLQAAVHTTVRRMLGAGEVTLIVTETSRCYAIAPAFEAIKGEERDSNDTKIG